MDYNLKMIINGVEVLEDTGSVTVDGVEYVTPSITRVSLQNSASQGAMDIGATATDKLQFTILNPYKKSFDGEIVEFWIEETDEMEETEIGIIAEDVGDDVTEEGLDFDENDSDLEEDEEDGEDLTEEEEADVDETATVNEEDLFAQLEGEDDTTEAVEVIDAEWTRVGIYYVYGQTTNDDGSITITAYDGFIKMNGFYIPSNYTGTVQTLYDDFRAQVLEICGIEVDEYEFDEIHNIDITWSVISTYRGAMGYFAGLAGGFAEFDADGTCGISFYSYTDNELLRGELFQYSEDSAGDMILQEISCNRAVNGTDIIEVGSGQGISFVNPFVTEEILDTTLQLYNGMKITGGAIKCLWDASLTAGQFIRIYEAEEYKNYLMLINEIENGTHTDAELLDLKTMVNALGTIMLIGSQVIDFTGNATTTITSGNITETEKYNALKPPVIQKIMEAGRTATNYLNQDETGALLITSSENSKAVRIDNDSIEFVIDDINPIIMRTGSDGYAEQVISHEETGGAKYEAIIQSSNIEAKLTLDDGWQRQTRVIPQGVRISGDYDSQFASPPVSIEINDPTTPDAKPVGQLTVNQYCNVGTSGTVSASDFKVGSKSIAPSIATGKAQIGDVLIQWGTVNVTPSSGSTTHYGSTQVDFPIEFSATPFVMACAGDGYTSITNVSAISPSTTSMTVWMSATNTTARTCRWFAIGKA